MKDVKGASLDHADLGSPVKVADLLHFDGPLLSLFRTSRGENLFYLWCDKEGTTHRWLVFRLSDKELEEFLQGTRSLRTLVCNPEDGFMYVLDLDADLSQKQAWIVSPKEFPKEYVPDTDSFYDDKPIILQRRGKTHFKIPIDGDWEPFDFHRFPRLVREAYAFEAAFLSQSAQQMPKFPMRDGFSSVHFFKEVLEKTPKDESPRLEAVRYSSPGAIVFETDSKTTGVLLDTLNVLRNNRAGAEASYDILHDRLAEKKLLGENAMVIQLEPEEERAIGKLAIDLARDLGVPNPDLLLKKSANAVMASKIILAFFRLIERILAYEKEGKIFFPSIA